MNIRAYVICLWKAIVECINIIKNFDKVLNAFIKKLPKRSLENSIDMLYVRKLTAGEFIDKAIARYKRNEPSKANNDMLERAACRYISISEKEARRTVQNGII